MTRDRMRCMWQVWAHARDDRPWGGADPSAVAYVHAHDRKAGRLMAHLAGHIGAPQVDGYEGYRALTKGGALWLAFCWILYATPRSEGLMHHADDGRVGMDPDTVERSIGSLALTRKNALIAGSDRGG